MAMDRARTVQTALAMAGEKVLTMTTERAQMAQTALAVEKKGV